MKRTKLFAIVLAFFMLVGILTGCSASNGSSGFVSDSKGDSISNEIAPMYPSDIEMGGATSDSNAVGPNSPSDNSLKSQKIIQTFLYSLESTNFDKSITELENAIKESDGYVESSNITGNKTYYKNTRFAEYTIRIPTKETNKFVEYIDNNCIVSRKEIDTEDVTTKYVDIQSRLSALRSEKDILEKLLSQATNMSDVLAIQNQLTNVIYEIESYEARLRTLDNLVDYTTIHITIDEVETPTVVEERTVWQEIKDRFGRNFDGVIDGLTAFFIFMVSSIPQFVVIAVIVLVVVFIVKMCTKKSKAKKAKNQQQTYNAAIAPQYYRQPLNISTQQPKVEQDIPSEKNKEESETK